MGGRYERQGYYLIPLSYHTVRRRKADRHFRTAALAYLREYRKVTYINLLTNGRLNTYLAEIDKQAQERFERLIEGMKQVQGSRNS